jgi:hypothetical protein
MRAGGAAARAARAGLALALSACGAEFPAAALATATDASGARLAELRTAPQPPTVGNLVAELTLLTNPGREPLDGLAVSVTPWMPAMRHGSSVVPTVVAQGEGGRYRIENLSLTMAGAWELQVAVAGASEDSLVLPFDVR